MLGGDGQLDFEFRRPSASLLSVWLAVAGLAAALVYTQVARPFWAPRASDFMTINSVRVAPQQRAGESIQVALDREFHRSFRADWSARVASLDATGVWRHSLACTGRGAGWPYTPESMDPPHVDLVTWWMGLANGPAERCRAELTGGRQYRIESRWDILDAPGVFIEHVSDPFRID